uniref:Uncharacterized protein LOC104212804 n=1 Tax=Nicotiana sylvestris TaxID=4096 RepID=A0A1U7UWP7_NICSY|nr:PREDICTED: uncharacterized protein LOC104212804 [Nicotiana sylvestris]
MGEESSKPNDFHTKDTIVSEKLSEEAASLVNLRFRRDSVGPNFPIQHDVKDSFSGLICGCLKVHSVLPGKISCILSVKPAISIQASQSPLLSVDSPSPCSDSETTR